MSAKLLKALASGKCTVVNPTTSEAIVYWTNDKGHMSHFVIGSTMTVDLLQYATVPQLRKSPNLKYLCNKRHLKVAP